MKKIILLILSLVLVLSGCGKSAEKSEKLKIVTTIYPIYDFARAAAGDLADVKLLIDPGTEVHSFDPAPSDIAAINDSDLFFYIGGESDSWVNSVKDGIKKPVPLLNSADLIEEEGHHHPDEHIWTSPYNAQKMISKIADELSEADSKNADGYRKNADSYNAQIGEIAEKIKSVVEKAENPFIVIADRNPYVYFANAFGIKYAAAFGGCANSTDISIKTMSALIDAVKENNLKCAYYNEMSSKNIAKTLAEETGIEIYQLNSAHNVTKDEFEQGVTYADLMEHNAEVLAKGWN